MISKSTTGNKFFGDLMDVKNINNKFTGSGGSSFLLISDLFSCC